MSASYLIIEPAVRTFDAFDTQQGALHVCNGNEMYGKKYLDTQIAENCRCNNVVLAQAFQLLQLVDSFNIAGETPRSSKVSRLSH